VEGKCQYCGRSFLLSSRHPKQCTCNSKACRNVYKNQWRKEKIATDADHQANKRDSQKRWIQKHPGYWRTYRQNHREYTDRNREMQRQRNCGRKQPRDAAPLIAKSDSVNAKSDLVKEQNALISGYYSLQRLDADMIAKSDLVIVQISSISGNYREVTNIFNDCKETTL